MPERNFVGRNSEAYCAATTSTARVDFVARRNTPKRAIAPYGCACAIPDCHTTVAANNSDPLPNHAERTNHRYGGMSRSLVTLQVKKRHTASV